MFNIFSLTIQTCWGFCHLSQSFGNINGVKPTAFKQTKCQNSKKLQTTFALVNWNLCNYFTQVRMCSCSLKISHAVSSCVCWGCHWHKCRPFVWSINLQSRSVMHFTHSNYKFVVFIMFYGFRNLNFLLSASQSGSIVGWSR